MTRQLLRHGSLLIGFLLCPSFAGLGQNEEAVSRLKLVVQREVLVQGNFKGPIQYPIRCDQQGRIYVRPYQPVPDNAPLLRFRSDGEHEATFSLQKASGFEKGRAAQFAVTPRGEVYFVASRELSPGKFEVALVGFDEDAKHVSTVRLGENFVASQIAPFLTGEFLVSGWTLTPEEGKQPAAEPFTAAFDIRGRLLNRLELPDDIREESENAEAQGPKAPMAAVDLGDAAAGLDGNVYLMRSTVKPLVYVVSPLGELVRRFEVTPPEEKAQPAGMLYGPDGLLVFDFEVIPGEKDTEHAQIFSLVNAETGQRLQDYESPIPGVHPLACYAPGVFTLFTWDKPDYRYKLVHAIPH